MPDRELPGFTRFRDYLERESGIHLADGKAYLVESRLSALMRARSLETLDALVDRLAGDAGLRAEVIDAMTTNETFWFRDGRPFEMLREVMLPELASRDGPIRIWSAGCSTGQEPYSIAMTAHEWGSNGSRSVQVDITATDVSPRAIATARAGIYAQLAISRGVDDARRGSFFESCGDRWRVIDPIRERVRFAELNLLDSFARLGRFELVFCRNVLIYFSRARRLDILERIGEVMSPGGFLVLGGTDQIPAIACFERERVASSWAYRRT